MNEQVMKLHEVMQLEFKLNFLKGHVMPIYSNAVAAGCAICITAPSKDTTCALQLILQQDIC